MTQESMYDTIFPQGLVGHLPINPVAVAGYEDGNSFIDASLLFHLFPEADHLSIGRRFGRCIDCEPGFATLADVPGFARTGDKSGGPLVGYASASNMSALMLEFDRAGINDGLFWTAHYTFKPHICGPNTCGYHFPKPVAATQWTDHGIPGVSSDRSLIADRAAFFPTKVPPKDPHNFQHFPTANPKALGLHGGPFPSPWGDLDERQVVLHYYGAYGQKRFANWQAQLEKELAWLAQRVAHVAMDLHPNSNGKPSWDVDFRGERFQRLLHMGEGKKPQ